MKCAAKKRNHNKDKNKIALSGTGHRFASNMVYTQYTKILPAFLKYQQCGKPEPDPWSNNHPGQVMESSLHDRTKWKTSKQANNVRALGRQIKLAH